MPIAVECPACQARFRAGDEHAGKKGKCPKCGGPITVPSALAATVPASASAARPAAAQAKPAAKSAVAAAPLRPTPVAQPRAAVPEARVGAVPPTSSLMADLLDEAAGEPLPPVRCNSCGRTLPAGTAVCITCGYNLRTGQKMQTVVERPKENKAAEGVKAAAGFAGSFLKGVLACSLATLLGGGVWVAIAMGIGLEIGWLAWGIGALAGVAMRLGYGKEDDVAGITAAFISVLGILGAKWIIFQSFLGMIREVLNQTGIPGEDLPSTSTLFFTTMMGWRGIVFLLLAFFTAYKVGSGKSSS